MHLIVKVIRKPVCHQHKVMTEIMISNYLIITCRTLNGRCCGHDSVPDMLTLWCLSKKYDLNN